MDPLTFKNTGEMTGYYDSRYSGGYMDAWDTIKQHCMADIIQDIQLPPKPRILDFGCGSGFFTRLLKQLRSDAQMVGVDLSPAAISQARQRDPDSAYFVLGDPELDAMKAGFDLVFSHHVLEHVLELDKAAADIASFAARDGKMLHILPCGNRGSFEFSICSLFPDGIDPNRGGRFFCEDPSHLRRMSTEDIAGLFERVGFRPANQYFSNQYWGALNWISETSPQFVHEMFNYRRADAKHRTRLFLYNRLCLALTGLRYAHRVKISEKFRNLNTMPPHQAAVAITKGIVASLLYPGAWVTNQVMLSLTMLEWNRHRHTPNGSEMAILFRRAGIQT